MKHDKGAGFSRTLKYFQDYIIKLEIDVSLACSFIELIAIKVFTWQSQ